MTTTPLDPQNFNSAAVNQSHDGQGDNVLNKYIQSIAPDLLRRPIQAILNAIANDDLDKAKSDIELIESMGGKDSNAQMLISALRIFNDLVGDEEQSRAIYQSLKQSLASTHQVPNDVITAALMLYEFKDSQEAMAAKRYLQTKHSPVSYSTYIFNKNLASTEQLSQFWEAHELNLDLPALKGLIIGALRVQAHDLLAKVYPSLEHYEPNLSNKALTFFCQGAILFPRFTNRHYYLLTYPDKVEVDRLVVEGASLLNQGQSDRMTIGACASFATYTQNEISDLPTALCPFINKIDDSFTVLKLNLQSYLNKEKTPSPVAFQDDDFIEGVLSSKHFPTLFTTNSAIMLRRALKLDLAPELARMEKLVRVSLLAKLVTIEPTTQRQLIDYLDKMLNDTPYDLTAYPFHHSYHLCNLLDEAELHRYIPKILAQFQIQGAWLSPPKGMYLDSLIKTKQLSTLNTTLALTHPDEHQALYHSCRARYFEAIGEDKNVLKHAYLAIESSDNHINAWIYLIKFAGRSQHVSSAELRSIFETIPDECFIRPSPYSWELLATCLRYGDFSRAERIALDLFVVSPNEMALHYSNWVNSAFLHDQGSFQPTYATTVGDHQNCYLLESNGTTNYKLVTAVKNQHPDFILPTSPLGKQLLEGKKGDTIENQLIEYRIVEIVSPFEGALQIANKLRQELNDGTDSFAMLTIPEDPKQLNEFLKKTIAMSNKRRSESSLQLLSDNNHPIQVRGAHQANHSKWSGAVAAILSPNFAKNSTPESKLAKPRVVLTDFYGLTLLAISKLGLQLKAARVQLLITQETLFYAKSWIKDHSGNYLAAGLYTNGELSITTEETFAIKEMISSLTQLLKLVTITEPILADQPDFISRLHKIFDESVTSTLAQSFATKTQYLSIDKQFDFLFQKEDIPFANTAALTVELCQQLPKEDLPSYLEIIIATENSLPYLYDQVLEVAVSQSENGWFIVLQLLKKSRTPFHSEFLINLILLVVVHLSKAAKSVSDDPSIDVFSFCAEKLSQQIAATDLKSIIERQLDDKRLRKITDGLFTKFINGG